MRTLLRALLLLVVAGSPVAADPLVIRLGTLAPGGSPWLNLLKEMGQEWSKASGGTVELKVYPNGTVGSEGDMVRNMRVGKIQAAAMSNVGLHDIAHDPQVLSSPLLIDTYAELDCVMGKVQAKLDKSLDDKGFVALQWGDVGFVYLFSSKPFSKPEEMKSHKIFAWDGDPASVEVYSSVGLQPIVLSSIDIIPSLTTGMIDTVAAAPLFAFTTRYFKKANHMLDLRWGILNGATVVRKDVWEKIPADIRAKLITIARAYGKRIDVEVRRVSEDAIKQMKAQGLQVVKPEDLAGWQRTADVANKVVRGKVVPAGIFDETQAASKQCRASLGTKP